MKTLTQAMIIEAPITRIWAAIIHQQQYETWTKPFSSHSTFTGTWQFGAEIHFHDQESGLVATVTTYDYPHQIGLHYIGVIEAGEAIYQGEQVARWHEAHESYHFTSLAPNTTRFEVTLRCPDDYYLIFEQMWANGLIALKHFCEQAPSLPQLNVAATFDAPVALAWHHWLTPESIQVWNHANDDWHCPKAVHDFRIGGTFSYTMAAKDGSFSFDFTGIFTDIIPNHYLAFLLDDGRAVQLHFINDGEQTHLFEQFEAESENPLDMQQAGWQAIVDNFVAFCLAQRS